MRKWRIEDSEELYNITRKDYHDLMREKLAALFRFIDRKSVV